MSGTLARMRVVAWVARLVCDHDVGAKTAAIPEIGGCVWCPSCQQSQLVLDIVDNAPLRDIRGRS